MGRPPACMARATSGGQIAGARGDGDILAQEVGMRGGGNKGWIAVHVMAMRGNDNDWRIAIRGALLKKNTS